MNLNNIIKNLDNATNADFEQSANRRDLLKSFGSKLALAAVPFAASTLQTNKAKGQSKESLIRSLNYLLKLEAVVAEFYKQALEKSGLIPEAATENIKKVVSQNTAQVVSLTTIVTDLGGTPYSLDTSKIDLSGNFGNQAEPGPFADALNSFEKFLIQAQMFSDGGARIYNGQISQTLSDNTTINTLMRIHSVKVRQAAYVRSLRKHWYGVDIKPWITGTNSDTSNTAVQRAYAGEALIVQGGISLLGINGQEISANAASQSFDEPLNMDDGNNIINRFIQI